MRVMVLALLAVLGAGCSAVGGHDVVVSFQNDSASEAMVEVAFQRLGGEPFKRVDLSAPPSEVAERTVRVQGKAPVLVSVAWEGETLGAWSIEPAKCAGDPFRVRMDEGGAVEVLGRSCPFGEGGG